MHPLVQTIADLQRRLLWRRRAVAVCWIAATVLATALTLAALDYVVQYTDPGLRIIATFVLALAATWAVYRWWYVPSRQRLVSLSVARQVEAHFPQLRDSLASAVEFLEQSEEDRTAGSAQLRRVVVAEAQTALEGLPLAEVIDRRPLRRAATWLAMASAVLFICVAFDARAVGTAMLRLAAPLGSIEWPRQHHLAFRGVPARLAAGQTFEAELINEAGPLPEEVRIEYRDAVSGGTQSSSELMSPAGDVMIARRENVRHSFAFRATGGDDATMRWHWVEVVEPPRLDSFDVVVHPPKYTGLPSTPAERHLSVIAGSSIEVRGTASEPLAGARIVLNGDHAVQADVGSAKTRDSHTFRLPPGRWVAATGGRYRVELTDAKGVAGVVGEWNLRVEPDPPPSVSWQRPMADLYVTASAILPIELAVKDNLAIQRVELVYEREGRSDSQAATGPRDAGSRFELYRGPQQPAAPSNREAQGRGDSRLVAHAWDLQTLQLDAGTQLTMHAEAIDYQPGTGRTASPRRITIITSDELESRLADRQAQIVRQLERALVAQQATREDVRRVEIAQRDADELTPGDRNALEAAELSQRRVGRMLVDRAEGVPALIDSFLEEVEMNRLSSDELRALMERLLAELDRLSAEPLGAAERQLTDAHKVVAIAAQGSKSAEADAPVAVGARDAEGLLLSLATAGAAQDEVIAKLEQLIAELSGRADYRRLAQQLAALRQDQLAHQKTARNEIGVETLPLRPDELSRVQRATLNKAAAGQNALAARFEKIQRSIDQLAQELADETSDEAGRLAAAADLGRRLAIASDMQQTARDIAANRLGQALQRETQIADKLQQVLDVLRNEVPRQPEQLASSLREAEEQLAALRQQVAALRAQIARAETQANADSQRLRPLSQQQQQLQSEIAQLAQQLDRLQAEDAGQSTRNAASRLENSAPGDNQEAQQPQRPSPASDVQKAEQDLEEAARQLAERRQQAEDDLALAFVRRFQAELAQMVKRQQHVVNETVAIDSQRNADEATTNAATESVADLANEERALAVLAREHGELLSGLGAVRISLEEAERRLHTAAKYLDAGATGSTAQRVERQALAQLEGMMDAFAQTASEATPQNQPPNAGAPDGQRPQRRPTFELLEVKMLRMLQVDLHDRTRDFEQRLAGLDDRSDDERAVLVREARELQAEQGRLAELVEQMLSRDNAKGDPQ